MVLLVYAHSAVGLALGKKLTEEEKLSVSDVCVYVCVCVCVCVRVCVRACVC